LDFAGFLAQGMLSPHPGFSHDLLEHGVGDID
jgi:hypothetical protein